MHKVDIYQAIALDEFANKIQGFVFCSENLPEHWAELDEFEGEQYKRVIVKVTLEDGRYTDVNMYILNSA